MTSRNGSGWVVAELTFLILSALGPYPSHVYGQGFNRAGTLPFDAIKAHQDIEDRCAMAGDLGTDTEPHRTAHRLQNLAKNNFCAEGDPVPVTFDAFAKLNG